MDLSFLLKRMPIDRFDRISVETDVDPEDDVTPGWMAVVRFKDIDGGHFLGCFDTIPSKAMEALIDELIDEGYIEESEIYGR